VAGVGDRRGGLIRGSLERGIRSVADAEYLARRRLPASLALEIECGDPGPTFGRNLEAFAAVGFRPRAGVAFAERDLRTTVLGHEVAFPVLIAPTGNLRINHPDGEPGVARAAGAAGTICCVSTFTGHPIESVTAAATGPVFFQVYFAGGRGNVETMIERAQRAGCAGLIVTLDTAAKPQAERHLRDRVFEPFDDDLRTAIRFLPQAARRPAWLAGFLRDGRTIDAPMALRADGSVMTMPEALATVLADPPTWEDLKWVREQWDGPVIAKGILSGDDARRAVDAGAAAVVVSNHGGHLLPGSVPTLRVLPEVVAAVGDDVEVLLDSGVRRGADAVKAMALGARAVLVGRACAWAHAAAGEAGVRRILDVLRTGVDDTLALLGCPSVAALDPSYVTVPAGFAP
jgi:isopentenyl diphosphate isomerase/L-lactate dehydrogenase-like FMN-dependent dehydrogenase